MEEYIQIDAQRYALEGIKNGTLVPRQAVKFARIIARPGIEGETVVTWSVDSNGQPIEERISTVTRSEKTGETGWVVCKSDENGNPIIDEHGHKNEWIIDAELFHKKYEQTELEGLYKPVGKPQVFVRLPINVIVNQWGQTMKIAAGGYLNVTNLDDVYGISQRDFDDTYRFVEPTIAHTKSKKDNK